MSRKLRECWSWRGLRIASSGLASVPLLLPPMLRPDIISQSKHSLIPIYKTAAGTGRDLLLLTQQAGPVPSIRVQQWPGPQAAQVSVWPMPSGLSTLGGMVGLGVASVTRHKVQNATLEYVLSLDTLGDAAEPV